MQRHKMLALRGDWAFVLALKATALKTDFGSEHCLMFCGDCGVKDGDCQGKSNYVGQRGQCSSYFGGNSDIFEAWDEGWNNDNLCQICGVVVLVCFF